MKLIDFDFRVWSYILNGYLNNQGIPIKSIYRKFELKNDDSLEVELCSAFHDCERRKIYDGDIVEDSSGERYRVAFDGDCFMLFTLNKNPETLYLLGVFLMEDYLRIIGNIHENAELLNCEKRKEIK